jgi:hypothetical protein
LTDGSSTGYGLGWSVGASDGDRFVTHDGDISGFTSDGILFPEEKLFVTIPSSRTRFRASRENQRS